MNLSDLQIIFKGPVLMAHMILLRQQASIPLKWLVMETKSEPYELAYNETVSYLNKWNHFPKSEK